MTSPIRSRSESNATFDSESYETVTCREPPKSTSSVGTNDDAACHAPSTAGETREPASTSNESAATSGRTSPDTIQTFVATSEADWPTIHAEAFAIKGRDPRTGIEAEVFSAGARTSVMQDEAQVGMARVGRSSDDGHWAARGQVFTAKAYSGTENADGTTGLNLGVGVTSVGADVKGTLGPVSATVGVSAGASLGGSIGVGDTDADGVSEACVRAEWAIWTAGGCVEKFW